MRPMPMKCLSLSLAGFVASTSLLIADDSSTVLALVNGTEITTAQIKELPGIDPDTDFASLDNDSRAQVIIGLVNRQLVLERVKKERFDQSEAIAKAVQDMADTFVIKQYLLKVAAGTDLSEEAQLAYYNTNIADQPEQYQIAHIQLASEEDARRVIGLLDEGQDFSRLAATESLDKVSADKGGDLGWLTAGEMLPSFYGTLSGLKQGEISARTARTPFGWHIVKLNGVRKPEPPSFEQAKPAIRQALVEEEINGFLEDLRANASIEVR